MRLLTAARSTRRVWALRFGRTARWSRNEPPEVDQPHESIEALLQQVEDYRLRREVRDGRPDEITQLITEAAELFEPMHGVARVGFNCEATPDGWAISLYLGATEVVGGRDDGKRSNTGFFFDLDAAIALFSTVDSIRFASQPGRDDSDDAGVIICGMVDQLPIRMAIHSVPPVEANAAMRRLPDRSLHLT